MSIIDRARAVAERRWPPSRHLEWTNLDYHDEGLVAGFTQGARWLLDQLQDPDQATVDAVAQAILSAWKDRGSALQGAPLRWEFKADARAAITALTNHLNGDPS